MRNANILKKFFRDYAENSTEKLCFKYLKLF